MPTADVGMHHRSIKERRKKRKLTSNSGAKCQTLKEDMGIHIIPERGVLVLSSTLFFFLVFQSQLLLLLALSSPTNSSSPQVPALIVFGDSIVDPGNNNYIKTIVKCNFPPYGQDFAGGVPTGRFCNGKIPSDFLAAKLGVKEYLPAYVGVELSPEDILTGVSFASGGAGYDPLTAKLVSVISMSDQLELLKEYKQKMIAVAGEKKAAAILSEALYGVCCGTDDIANTYFGTPFRITHYDIPSYVDLMVDSATSFLEDLIKLGARKIAFVGLPPIGCVPSQRTLAGGIARDCDSTRNGAAQMFNSKMSEVLDTLKSKYHLTMVYLDIYHPLLDIIQRPSNYGFMESTKGCCGTGKLEVSVLCNSFTPVTCEDDSKYVFWDSYHPTEKAYDVLTDILLQKYLKYLS